MAFASFFFVTVWLLEMANGLDTCKGPFTSPSVEQIEVDPIYRNEVDTDHIIGADIKLVMKSSVPLEMQWSSRKHGIKATKDNDKFKPSVDVTGDRYVFKLHNRLYANTTTDRDRILHDLKIRLLSDYGCNLVIIPNEILSNIMSLYRAGLPIPTITEMPPKRIVLESDDDVVDLVPKFGFSSDSLFQLSYFSCWRSTEEQNGVLRSLLLTSPDSRVRSTTQGSQGECYIKMPKTLDSLIMGMYVSFRVPKLADRAYIALSIDFEIRRRRAVDKPSVLVQPKRTEHPAIMKNGETIIPAKSFDYTVFTCLAGGFGRPVIQASTGRDFDQGSIGMLRPFVPQTNYSVRPLQYAKFLVKSPNPTEEDEYVCSATIGREVTNLRFKLAGYVEIDIRHVGPPKQPIFYDQLTTTVEHPLELACAARSAPTPQIRFFTNIPYSDTYFRNITDLVNQVGGHEIQDSRLYQIYRESRGITAYAKLSMKDVRAVVPDGYWQKNRHLTFVCVAFHEYDIALLKLVTIYQ